MKGIQGRRCKKPLDDRKEKKGPGNLKRKHSVDNSLSERLWICRKQTMECMITICDK